MNVVRHSVSDYECILDPGQWRIVFLFRNIWLINLEQLNAKNTNNNNNHNNNRNSRKRKRSVDCVTNKSTNFKRQKTSNDADSQCNDLKMCDKNLPIWNYNNDDTSADETELNLHTDDDDDDDDDDDNDDTDDDNE